MRTCAWFDHMLAEAREISRAGAAGVDRSSDAASARELLGVDAKRRAAPIDMRVKVDEAGRHDDAPIHRECRCRRRL